MWSCPASASRPPSSLVWQDTPSRWKLWSAPCERSVSTGSSPWPPGTLTVSPVQMKCFKLSNIVYSLWGGWKQTTGKSSLIWLQKEDYFFLWRCENLHEVRCIYTDDMWWRIWLFQLWLLIQEWAVGPGGGLHQFELICWSIINLKLDLRPSFDLWVDFGRLRIFMSYVIQVHKMRITQKPQPSPCPRIISSWFLLYNSLISRCSSVSLSANSGTESPYLIRFLLLPMIRSVLTNMFEMEQFLQKIQDINWTVVRPPGLKNLPASGTSSGNKPKHISIEKGSGINEPVWLWARECVSRNSWSSIRQEFTELFCQRTHLVIVQADEHVPWLLLNAVFVWTACI